MKKSKIAALSAIAGLGLVALAGAPAVAAEKSLGAYSCSVSVKVDANTTRDTFIRANAGGQSKSKSFPGTSVAKTHTLYTGWGATTSAGVSTGGSIYSFKYGCDY